MMHLQICRHHVLQSFFADIKEILQYVVFFAQQKCFNDLFLYIFTISFQPPDSNLHTLQGFVERIPGVTTLVKDPVSGDLRARSGNQVWCVGCPYTKGWVPSLKLT